MSKATLLEFALPLNSANVPLGLLKRGWFRHLGNMDQTETTRNIASHFDGLVGPLAAFARFLCDSKPTSLIAAGAATWLKITRMSDDGIVSWYLREPADPLEIATEICKHGIGGDMSLYNFLLKLDGLVDCDFGSGYGFRCVADWSLHAILSDAAAPCASAEGIAIYSSSSGDTVMLERDGHLGWHVFDSNSYRRVWRDFEQFLESYVFVQLRCKGFDSYSEKILGRDDQLHLR